MTKSDYLKALGVALLLLIINVALSILVVTVYAVAIEPGHDRQFYDEAALRIVPWCSNIIGTALFFAAGFECAKRQPQRNGFAFAIIFTLGYAIFDAAAVGFANVISGMFALFMSIKLTGALAGTALALRTKKRRQSIQGRTYDSC